MTGTGKRTLFFHGAPADNSEFCDHPDVDMEVVCDDTTLWSITIDGELMGFVCDPHRDAYKEEAGIE